MNRDSLRLALAGAMIGLLTLSAALTAGLAPPRTNSFGMESAAGAPEQTGEAGASDPDALPAWAAASEDAAATAAGDPQTSEPDPDGPEPGSADAGKDLSPETGDAGPFPVVLRVEAGGPEGRLFLCGADGCPLEEVLPDADGEAALGPLAPGRYSLLRGSEALGGFRLLPGGSLAEATGQLRIEGDGLTLIPRL